MRAKYKRGGISQQYVREIDRVRGWSWDSPYPSRAEQFQHWLELLKTYARREGHARVPGGHRERGAPLGVWVAKLRTGHRRGSLSPKLVRTLEGFPGWVWDARDLQLSKGLDHLRRYVAREGHSHVSASHREGGFWLGAWIASKRVMYRKGILSRELAKALEGMPGWTWEPRGAHHEEALRALRLFTAREGHSRIPYRHAERGFPVGLVASAYRTQYRAGRLSSERVADLEKIRGWKWEPRPSRGG
jgi:hypothetical protein